MEWASIQVLGSLLSLQWIFNWFVLRKGPCTNLWDLSLILRIFFNACFEKHRCLTHFVQLNGPLWSEIDTGRWLPGLHYFGKWMHFSFTGSPWEGEGEGRENADRQQQGDSVLSISSGCYTQAARFIIFLLQGISSILSVKSSITLMTSCWGVLSLKA